MADEIKQLDLFGEEVRPKAKYVQGQVGMDDYGEFTEKFKAKLTTDDCYTPVEVYEAVLGWLREKVDLSGANIVRPFWPGGDYEAYDYREDDVVVDNPPFSILAGILRFYQARGVASASMPKYEYPPEVLTSSMLGYLSTHGVEFVVMRDEVSPRLLSALAAQRAVGKGIFGNGWLISEKKAAERKAAENVIVWELSDVEREAVRRIDKKKRK